MPLQRLNVILSRSKCLMIILGNPVTLSRNADFKFLIKECRQQGTFLQREQVRMSRIIRNTHSPMELRNCGSSSISIKTDSDFEAEHSSAVNTPALQREQQFSFDINNWQQWFELPEPIRSSTSSQKFTSNIFFVRTNTIFY